MIGRSSTPRLLVSITDASCPGPGMTSLGRRPARPKQKYRKRPHAKIEEAGSRRSGRAASGAGQESGPNRISLPRQNAPRREAPGLLPECAAPFHQRARECRALDAPAASCALWGSGYAHEYSQRVHRNRPAFPAQWFYGLWRARLGGRLFRRRRLISPPA